MERGFDATTMEEIAADARVSKPTLYRYYKDKERLYAAIVQATTDDIDLLVQILTDDLAGEQDLREGLCRLAEKLLSSIMEPEVLKVRRLVIAQAERFPEVSRSWFEQGFGRVLETLSGAFRRYAREGFLKVDDPLLAANHFTGLLLWIPVNQVMFSGNLDVPQSELDRYSSTAVDAFLKGYGAR